jgi:hypothetical protein
MEGSYMKEQRQYNSDRWTPFKGKDVDEQPGQPATTLYELGLPAKSNTLKKSPERGQEEMVGVIFKMQKDLFDHGKRRAVESGALLTNSNDLQALEEHASAIARESHRDLYDPTQHAHDQLLESEHAKRLTDRVDTEQAEKYALAVVREREEEAAQTQVSSPPPKPSRSLQIAASVVIACTIAPTLHDFIFVMTDDFISWTLSLIAGLFMGLFITIMILADVDSGDRKTAANYFGLVAGILTGLALGGLRVKDARTVGDLVFALAMTVLEISIVIGLEHIAQQHRAARQGWAARKIISDQTNGRLSAAQTHLDRYRSRLKELNEAITGHINYVEERSVRCTRIEEIEATALKAVRDGYHSGLAENRGHVIR